MEGKRNSGQDEIRQLIKEAKQQSADTAASRPKTLNKSTTTSSAAMSVTSVNSNAPTRTPAIPVGFFDDSVADAKARHVDVQQLAEKQLKSDWEAFQEFAAEVEQESAKEELVQKQETKEREAVEELENMQYVDRYRVALERVTSLRNGEKKIRTDKRKAVSSSTHVLEEEDDDIEALDAGIVESAVLELRKKKRKTSNKHQQQTDSDDSSELDLCNWRSRGF
uniref:ZNF380 coiled-coil domain-containing protein n=1 Tax=Hyaloperonospora arabidopsidis (strain Emoy2) TaxID=559515 RepID=M4BHU8_HYAAE